MNKRFIVILLTIFVLAVSAEAKRAVVPEDIFAMKDVGEAKLSPDGSQIVYVQSWIDRAKNRSYANLWLMPTNSSGVVQVTTGEVNDAMPRWSPDGKFIAFASNREGKAAIWILELATKQIRMVTVWERSNAFISKSGESLCWSPDSKQIAFVAAEKPAEPQSQDPVVITRLQYKTRTSFSDNLRSHIFIVSLDDKNVRQLTRGSFDEHSISWSPDGKEIACLSNRQGDADANLNYDIFCIEVVTGKQRRLTSTPGVEMSPVWSPDGNYIAYVATKRHLTTIDSVAEDAHVWVIGREAAAGKEISAAFDRRANSALWSADSLTVYFTAGDKGRTLIYKVSRNGGAVTPVFEQYCQIGSLNLAGQTLVFTKTDELNPSDIWKANLDGSQMKQLTAVNQSLVDDWNLIQPVNFKFKSFDKTEVEGWLMRPIEFEKYKKHPMILGIHGGPHGAFGYGFNLNNQIYAAHGYAVLYLNPRGSSGYGQKFSDGCINGWGEGDYNDLMKGVDYALANNQWIDANRLGVTGGSYGGFMTNWVITQTPRFKVAIASASVSNLISFYGTSLYQDLIHAEFRGFPWDNYELLWRYSPIHYVKSVETPTMFIHGELDNDVHITQAEEMYMGLRRRGIESVFVRYPREGHGLREPLHRLDQTNRMLAWFDKFIKPGVEENPNQSSR
jgi:dipeptidyl aminopeptidase/acylaminoacyl peptidase